MKQITDENSSSQETPELDSYMRKYTGITQVVPVINDAPLASRALLYSQFLTLMALLAAAKMDVPWFVYVPLLFCGFCFAAIIGKLNHHERKEEIPP